jgi:Flp pilus assembly protein TadG
MRWLGKFWSDESGASAALYALALPALVGAVGIGFDYARVAGMDSELQNAADQAALAGATQLDQLAGSVARATAAARNGLATNETLNANDSGGLDIEIPEGQVYFYATKADAEAGTNAIDPDGADADSDAQYIRVKVETRRANYALTPVVGALYGDLAAEAVAGIGSAVCRIPPLMMCNPDEPLNNTDRDVDFVAANHVGQGLLVVQQGSWDPGAFGFLDLGNGATAVEQALAWTSITGQCVPVNGPDVIDAEIETGLKASTQDAINTRFDIYDNCPAGGNCPASINSIKDVTHLSDASGVANLSNMKKCTYGQNGESTGWQQPANPYLPDTSGVAPATLSPMGHPRDVCHSTDPKTCTRFGDGFWDRDAYFRSRYGWTSSQWQTNTGLTLGSGTRPSTPTRYDVYKWEIDHRDTVVGGRTILGPLVTSATRTNYAKPICSPDKGFGSGTVPSAPDVADRRVMSVAVINCQAEDVHGKSGPYRIRRFVDIFLVEPSLKRTRTEKTDIYVEIIGESDASGVGETAGTVIRRDVPFLIK